MHEVRLLTESDAHDFWNFRLAALEQAPHAFAESAAELQATPVDVTAARLRASNEDSFVLGAFVDGRMVGTAGVFRNPSAKAAHKARVWGVYVDPTFRQRGIAGEMMRMLLARVSQVPGVQQVSLTVATTQLAAIALYDSLGFITFGLELRSLLVDGTYIAEEHRVLMLDVPSSPE